MLPPGVHHYKIPRTGFVLFSEIEIHVKAVNALGQATSTPLLLEPMESGKEVVIWAMIYRIWCPY